MKAKGTSVWERYVEYVAIVAAIAVMGWFAWGAFGTKIEHRQGKVIVRTDTVDEALIKAAGAIENKLRDGTPSPINIEAPEALYDKFTTQLNQSISPNNRVVFPCIDMTAELDADQDIQSELREYVSPVVPEPSNMRTRQWFGTIAESTMAEVEGMEDSIEGPPHDTMWVQVASTIDISTILESFKAKEELSAIPEQWYDGSVDIFDVEIQRQRKVDGGWTSPEIVPMLPGHLSYRTQLSEGKIDAIQRDAIVRDLRAGKQDSIVHPEFYKLKGFKPKELEQPGAWTEDVDLEESPLQILNKTLKDANEDIEKQEKVIEKIEEDIRDAGASGGGGRGGGRGGGTGGSTTDKKIEGLRKKLAKANEKLDELNESKKEIEQEIEDFKSSNSVEDGEEILSGEIWIWGHDMNVDPGQTYRYRMYVQLANPFFGHKPSLYPQQHSLADNVVLASKQSDWSEPIEVQKTKQWFVKKAKTVHGINPLDLLDYGYISVDVFEFSDGLWTKKSRDIRVGQPMSVDGMDEGLGWFVLDVVEDVQGEVALLQHLETGQLLAKRPSLAIENDRLRQLLEQIREQGSMDGSEEAQDDSDSPPPSGGGRGGGGGIGGGRGGGIGGGRQ